MRLILSLLFLPLLAFGQEAIETHTLKNGLKILVKEDKRAPVAVSMLWYKVGSADESSGLTGLSHALEHLMFKGTPKHPQGEYSKIISDLGGQLNAFTNDDYTAYYVKIAANQLETAFELEADRMQHLQLKEDEFMREMNVIREERRMRTDDNPQGLAFERFLATAHLSWPYQHPVVGWMSDLETLKLDDALKWYHTYYAPNNATLVVVGDVQPQVVFDLAQKYFGEIPTKPTPKPKRPIEPPNLGRKHVDIHATAEFPMLIMGFTAPTLNTTKDKKIPYTLEIIAGLLDAGDSAPFNKNLVRGQHLATQVDVYYNLYSRYEQQFIIYGSPTPKRPLKALEKGIWREIEKLQHQPVHPETLNRVKNQIIAQKTFEKDSIFGQAMELGLLETVGLSYVDALHYTENITAVTPKEIQRVATLIFKKDHMTVGHLIPIKKHKES